MLILDILSTHTTPFRVCISVYVNMCSICVNIYIAAAIEQLYRTHIYIYICSCLCTQEDTVYWFLTMSLLPLRQDLSDWLASPRSPPVSSLLLQHHDHKYIWLHNFLREYWRLEPLSLCLSSKDFYILNHVPSSTTISLNRVNIFCLGCLRH